MRTKIVCFALVLVAVMAAMADALIEETVTLAKGWNGVYFESTPVNADCEVFFADWPVERVAGYRADAYESTVQVDDEGEAINQKPVSFDVWQRGKTALSALRSIHGGNTYLVYATQACTRVFLGEPGVPRMTWRASSTSDGFANLVAPSLPTNVLDMTANTYFGEGPAGTAAGIWQVGGTASAAPQLLPLGMFAKPLLYPGRAYVMTAAKNGNWPGVVEISGALGGVSFTSNGTDQAGFWLANRGTKKRTFTLTYDRGHDGGAAPQLQVDAGDGWEELSESTPLSISFEAGQQRSVNFALDRSRAGNNEERGGILTIADEGGTKMRVRVPVKVQPRTMTAEKAAWPQGFWAGTLKLTAVNFGTNTTPVSAGGAVESMVLLNWGTDNRAHLLQRVSFGTDPVTTKTRFFTTLEKAKASLGDSATIRRLTSVLLDPDQPDVQAHPVAEGTNGKRLDFAWTVDKYSSTNPMRHSWHPDHDGVTYKSDGTVELAPDGDNLANYTYSVKPELFSIGNAVSFTIDDMTWTPNETVSGTVKWTLTGLKSAKNGPLVCAGTFEIRRVSDNAVLE